MYPKYRTQKLIDKYGSRLIECLGLSKWQINIHVYKSSAVLLDKLKLAKTNRKHLAGVSFIGHKTADIIIYYDELVSRKDALGTIIHELLHLRLDDLAKMVTIKQDAAHKLEEQIVLSLEKTILEVNCK